VVSLSRGSKPLSCPRPPVACRRAAALDGAAFAPAGTTAAATPAAAATTAAAASHLGRVKIFINRPFVPSSGDAGILTAVIPPLLADA
jgi:hypothetical protein